MKLVTFAAPGSTPAIGVVLGQPGAERVLDLPLAHRLRMGQPSPHLTDMLALIDSGSEGLVLAAQLADDPPEEATHALAEVQLLAPLPLPRQIRDFMVFEEHVRNALAQIERLTGTRQEIPSVWYEHPIYYKANRFSVVGPDADIRWPRYSELLDYELELACIVGRQGVDIPVDQAGAYVFGYTIFNDVSARDAQAREWPGGLGPAKGKDFDTGNVLGPWIVTTDEIGDPYDLTMVARVNGEEWSRGSSGAMYHRFEDIIAFVSQSETLYPGEVLGSGTVGTGCGLELGKFPSPGDVIELDIERIGVLRNRMVR